MMLFTNVIGYEKDGGLESWNLTWQRNWLFAKSTLHWHKMEKTTVALKIVRDVCLLVLPFIESLLLSTLLKYKSMCVEVKGYCNHDSAFRSSVREGPLNWLRTFTTTVPMFYL
jgi:hypothetical protein